MSIRTTRNPGVAYGNENFLYAKIQKLLIITSAALTRWVQPEQLLTSRHELRALLRGLTILIREHTPKMPLCVCETHMILC